MAKLPPPPTRSGLLPEARHVVLPNGIATSGFPSIRETCRRIGVEFDDWQSDLNRCLLAKTPDGLYAADTVALSLARQVGKTFDIGAVVFAECIANPGTTVVWTAHRFKVARETFTSLRALAKSPKLVPHLDYDAITTAAGNECIPFRNGSRIVFAARERGAIRGFSKVRILILDEAQILTDAALSDLAPTMNQAENPLIILMGTPPKPADPSEVFTNLRADALSGVSEGVLYVEFSANPDCSLDDRNAWRQANPSFPVRTPARAILRMRKLLSTADFAREALGIWDADRTTSLFPSGMWDLCADPLSTVNGKPSLAVAMTPDSATVSLGRAGRRADGLMHVEIVEHGPSGPWFTDKVIGIAREQSARVTLHPGHAAGAMFAAFQEANLRLDLINGTQYAAGCGAFYDDVINGGLKYVPPQTDLTEAVARASRKPYGDTWRWAGDRISALVAASQAAQAARMMPAGGKGRAILLK